MEVLGKVKLVGEPVVVSPTFTKRDLVVTTDEQYPQHILIEFTQDKIDLLENLSIGTDVKVSINLGGREWINPQGEARYFNSVRGWRMERLNTQNNPQPTPQANQSNSFADMPKVDSEEHDDLPF